MTGLIQQTIKRLQNQISEENDLLHTLKEETDNINLKMLHSLLAITIIGFPTLIIIGFFIPHFENLHLIYSPPWLICLCLRLWCRKLSSHKRILISMYALFAVFLMITLYISAIVAPESMASGPVAYLLLLPVIIMDRSLRINLFMLLSCVAHMTSSFLFKPYEIAINDIVSFAVFAITGMVLGTYMKKIKLINIFARRQLQIQSHTDTLTGLSNRRKMFEEIAISEEKNCPEPIRGVIMIDIDYFKQYNDTYGHQQGDRCLQQLSACFFCQAEQFDLEFFRYGGEEFIAFSRTHDYEQLQMIAEKIRQAVCALHIPMQNSPNGEITITSGIAEMIRCQPSGYGMLIDMADAALYYGKASGRNTVTGYLDIC